MNLPDYAPFDPAQRDALRPLLLGLSPDQATWLSAFLAGTQAVGQGTAAPAVPKPELTVLFGTESGNSEILADQTAALAKRAGFKAKVRNMSDTKAADLAGIPNMLVVVSTWGDGDPPDAALAFHGELMGDAAPQLGGMSYSVCALGDTSYEQFCETGKQVDRRLEELGAKRVYARQDCDVDFEEPWEQWAGAAIAALPQPAVAETSSPTLAAVPVEAGYGKKRPWQAEILEKINLNGTGSAKETWHLELSLEGSGLTYEPGDSLAVIPENREEDVDALLGACGFDHSLAADFRTKYDITTLSANFAQKYNQIAGSKALANLLEPANKSELQAWLYGRQIVDLVAEFPVPGLNSEQFTSLLRKLQPRLYSIASSLRAHEDEVHLTVAAVRYQSHGRDRVGVASTYLADRVASGEQVPAYVHANKNFRLPEDNETPIIMVGPGTGVAPFRAFVEERAAVGAKGKNWLFFGDQHYTFDFLYQLEWQQHLKEGSLHQLDLAFSRDQKEKIYVQQRMIEHAADVYRWLEDGASFYVCGDASRMAKDVHEALLTIVEQQGGKTREAAEAYVEALRSDKRYLRDVY